MNINSKAEMQTVSKNSNESIQGPHEEMPSDYEEYASNLEIETTINKFANSEINDNNMKNNNNMNINNLNSTPRKGEKTEFSHEKEIKVASSNERKKDEEKAILHSRESEKSNYDVHKLRQKIQEQAARLQKLEQYKFLCENRILQLDPMHPLPVQELHLKKHSKDNKAFANSKGDFNNTEKPNDNNNNNQNEVKNLEDEIYNLNQRLLILTEELNSAQNKNLYLEGQINNLNSAQISFTRQSHNFPTLAGFPLPGDKITNQALRDSYNKLYLIYSDYLSEKNQILESLKMETINSEEQKNYIEILKQTIDSFILKNGLTKALDEMKKRFYGKGLQNNRIPANVDFLTELTQLRLEAEKSRKELVLSQALISELKREVEFLTTNNSNMISSKDKILENLESGIQELDQAKNKLKKIENENLILKKEIEQQRKSSRNLEEEVKQSRDLAVKLQGEKEELDRKLVEAREHLENAQTLQRKLFDYKKNFDAIYVELNEALNAKKLLEADLLKNKNELEKVIIENCKIKEELNLVDLERNNFLTEKDNCYKQIDLLQKINKEMESCQKAKEAELNALKDKLDKLLIESSALNKPRENPNFQEARKEYEKLKQEYEEFKLNSEKAIENLHKKLEEKLSSEVIKSHSLNVRKAAYEKTDEHTQKANTIKAIDYKEFRVIQDENDYLRNKINLLESESANKRELMLKLNERYDKLFVEFNELDIFLKQIQQERESYMQESVYWKKKYDADLMKKIGEIQGLNNDLSNYHKELIENQETINKLKKSLSLADEKNYNLSERLKKIESESLNSEEYKSKFELIKKELDLFTQENRELKIKIDVKNRQLEELDQKQNFFEDDLNQKDKEKYKLHLQAKSLEKELEETKLLLHRYENKINELNNELNSIYNKNKELTEKANTLQSSKESLSHENNQLQSELDYLNSENTKLEMELQNTKSFEAELQTKLSDIKSNYDEIENLTNSILLIIKAYAIKFEVTEHVNKSFEKTFAEKAKNFLSFYTKGNCAPNAFEALKVIEDWVKTSCFQIEKAEQKLNLSNDLIEESANKIKRLEKNLNEMSFYEEEKLNSQKNLSFKIKQLEDEKKLMLENQKNLESELDAIVREFNHLKLETKSKVEALGDSAQEINELRAEKEKLRNENCKLESKMLTASFQEKALEGRIKIILKENKYFENLLNKLASVHPVKSIARIVNDIMNICDSVSTLERDKLKIINNLNNIGYESSQLKSDLDYNVSSTLKFEKDENMRVLNDYNRKIEGKKDELNKLEAEMLLSQVNQLSAIDKTHNYEIQIDQLTADLNQANTEIKKLKNKLFLYQKSIDPESNTSIGNFRGIKGSADYTEEAQLASRTPNKNRYDRKIFEKPDAYMFLNEEPTKLNITGSPFRTGISQELSYNKNRSNFAAEVRGKNYIGDVNSKNNEFYNLKPIGTLKSENKSLNKLDQGVLEFYRP